MGLNSAAAPQRPTCHMCAISALKELDANRLGNQKHFTVKKSPDRLIYRCLSAHMIVICMDAARTLADAVHPSVAHTHSWTTTARSGGWGP